MADSACDSQRGNSSLSSYGNAAGSGVTVGEDGRVRDMGEVMMTESDPDYSKQESLDLFPTNSTRDWLQNNWAPFILHGSTQAHMAVLALFGVITASGFYWTFKIEEGFPMETVFTDDSYISLFFARSKEQFVDEFWPFSVVFKSGVKYEDPAVRGQIKALEARLLATDYVMLDFSSWITQYEGSVYFDDSSSQKFYGGARAFLGTEVGLLFNKSIEWGTDASTCSASDSSGCITSSQINSFFRGDISVASEQQQLVEDVRAIADNSGLDCFVFSFTLLIWEVWTELIWALIKNLSQAFVSICLGCLLFLLHPLMSVIVVLNVLCVEFQLIGATALMGINLNTATVCIFIMNFGLVVDYSAHIAHMFMTVGGTRRERAATAVVEMGSGVFNGAFTTILGFVPMVVAPFEIGRIFLYLFCVIVGMGVLHGFVVLPIVLAHIGPKGIDVHSRAIH